MAALERLVQSVVELGELPIPLVRDSDRPGQRRPAQLHNGATEYGSRPTPTSRCCSSSPPSTASPASRTSTTSTGSARRPATSCSRPRSSCSSWRWAPGP